MNTYVLVVMGTVSMPLKIGNSVDWKLVVSMIIVTLMVYVRDLQILPISYIYYLGVIFILCAFLPYRSLRSFFYFMIPFCYSMHGGVFIPILFFLVLKSKSYNLRQYLFPFFIAIFEFIHFSSYSFDVDFGKYAMYSIIIFLFFITLFDNTMDNDDVMNAVRCYIIGTALVMFIIILISTMIYSYEEVLLGDYRIGGDGADLVNATFFHTFMNANTLAFFSITAIALLLYVKDAIHKGYLKAILLTVLSLAGILSASRTWIIVLALMLFHFFSFSKIKGKLGFAIIALMFLLFASQYSIYVDAFTNRITGRFEEENLITAGSRVEIFQQHNQYLLNNPERIIYGTGVIYNNEVSGLLSSHNGMQQIYFCYGIIGSLVFLLAAILYYKLNVRRNNIKFWYCVPFFICFLFDQSIQFLSPYVLMLPFIATTLPMKLKDEILINDN